VKDSYREKEATNKASSRKTEAVKKSYAGRWIFAYIFFTVWIVGFHYFGEEKRADYSVVFTPEGIILFVEDYLVNTLLETDTNAIRCFFHNEDC
jgi:hypothetical protein